MTEKLFIYNKLFNVKVCVRLNRDNCLQIYYVFVIHFKLSPKVSFLLKSRFEIEYKSKKHAGGFKCVFNQVPFIFLTHLQRDSNVKQKKNNFRRSHQRQSPPNVYST